MYHTAILLAAGKGSRLMPITNSIPKPMVRVTDKTIIENALLNLECIGIKEVYIVTGYLSEILQANVGSKYRGLNIHYIKNEVYDSTNSMYSLYLGIEAASNKDIIVLEGDVFFELDVLRHLPYAPMVWVADSSIKDLDGCYLKCFKDKVVQIGIYKHKEIQKSKEFVLAKSTGILTISKGYIGKIQKMLLKAIEEKKTNLYYDLIISENIENIQIELLDVSNKKWYEIDTVEDLNTCRKIFNYVENSINNN